jgi:hypothetical protein
MRKPIERLLPDRFFCAYTADICNRQRYDERPCFSDYAQISRDCAIQSIDATPEYNLH